MDASSLSNVSSYELPAKGLLELLYLILCLSNKWDYVTHSTSLNLNSALLRPKSPFAMPSHSIALIGFDSYWKLVFSPLASRIFFHSRFFLMSFFHLYNFLEELFFLFENLLYTSLSPFISNLFFILFKTAQISL